MDNIEHHSIYPTSSKDGKLLFICHQCNWMAKVIDQKLVKIQDGEPDTIHSGPYTPGFRGINETSGLDEKYDLSNKFSAN